MRDCSVFPWEQNQWKFYVIFEYISLPWTLWVHYFKYLRPPKLTQPLILAYHILFIMSGICVLDSTLGHPCPHQLVCHGGNRKPRGWNILEETCKARTRWEETQKVIICFVFSYCSFFISWCIICILWGKTIKEHTMIIEQMGPSKNAWTKALWAASGTLWGSSECKWAWSVCTRKFMAQSRICIILTCRWLSPCLCLWTANGPDTSRVSIWLESLRQAQMQADWMNLTKCVI